MPSAHPESHPSGPPAGPSDGPAAATSDLVSALVDPLLDGRTQPAGDHFDRLVATALSERAISAELAHELRFWQRASVHELADHVRTVLPAVLPVALAAVACSAAEAQRSATAAALAWAGRDFEVSTADLPAAHGSTEIPDAQPAPEVVVSAADEIALNTAPPGDDTETAPVTNPYLRRRMFVAGLTSTA